MTDYERKQSEGIDERENDQVEDENEVSNLLAGAILVPSSRDSSLFSLDCRLGVPTNSKKSNRPGRVTAASKDLNRFVATMKITDC